MKKEEQCKNVRPYISGMRRWTVWTFCCWLLFFIFASGTRSAELGQVEIHGFISQGYVQSSDNNYLAATKEGTFEFNEVGINFGTWVTPGLKVGMQLVARDLGLSGNDEVGIDWATGEYYWKSWLNFRVGKMKAPHGMYNETRDIDLLRTGIFLPNSVYMEENRDELSSLKGGGVFGRITMGRAGALIYQGMGGVTSIGDTGGMARKMEGLFVERNFANRVNQVDVGKTVVANLQWETPLKGMLLGFSAVDTELKLSGSLLTDSLQPVPVLRGDRAEIEFQTLILNTFSMEYSRENLMFSGEYMRSFHDYTYTIDSSIAGRIVIPFKNDMEGFYGNASYRLSEWLELGSYYSVYFFTRELRESDFHNYQKDWALSTRFDIDEHWIFKIEGHLMRGTAFLNVLDHDVDGDPSKLEEDWMLFAAKATFVF